MQKKALITQLAFLSTTMVFGLLLKFSVFDQARAVHRLFGILSLVVSLLVMIIIVSKNSTRLQTGLTIGAFAACLLASVGGNISRTAQHDAGYILMISAFTVAVTLVSINIYTSCHRQPTA